MSLARFNESIVMSLASIARYIAWYAVGIPCLVVLLLVLVGCKGPHKPVAEAPDPLWGSVIAAHTSGPVPRKSSVRIVFARDVAPAARTGKLIDGLLKIEPSLDGQAIFESPRELVFKPKSELVAGQTYRFELRPSALLGLPDKLANYSFIVQALPSQFDLRFQGLNTRIDSGEMLLHGELVTADVEAPQQVEQLLKAVYANRDVHIDWQHSAPLTHGFTVSELKRGSVDQTLTLSWSGKPLGSSQQGNRDFTIPALQAFVVTQVLTVGDAADSERHIVVYFSDAVDAKQDFRGLIRVGTAIPRLRAEGNALHIYLSDKTKYEQEVVLHGSIHNLQGKALGKDERHTVTFAVANPQVRWIGNGVILPRTNQADMPLGVSFEAVNLRSVRVTAFQVYEDNLPQFLQVNKLDGNRELGRVGRYLWRKSIRLSTVEEARTNAGRWTRYSLDLSELIAKHPGDLVRLNLSFGKKDVTNDCGQEAGDETLDGSPQDVEQNVETAEQADAMWDQVQYDYEAGESLNWYERDNPCKAAYYYYGQNARAARNFIASNFGLLAKRDQQGELMIAVTDLASAEPLPGVKLTAYNFQNQPLGAVTTAVNGLARFRSKAAPALVIAEQNGKRGYLKLAPGVALPVSHFDVGGEKVAAGIKATIYGERGVWRPGDTMYLSFVLQDSAHSLPENHPVTMELFNPQQQLVQTLINDKPVDGFYSFALKTAENAPTGDWTAKATLGGNTFTKTLKVETVMPNRLKIELDMAALKSHEPIDGKINAQWLTGATAAHLHADVKLKLTKSTTQFEKFETYAFDDPARDFSDEPGVLFDGELDDQGRADIHKKLSLDKEAPGVLNATLITRVFERSGAFSIHRETTTLSPYKRYIGLRLPKGNAYNDALVADQVHSIEIASLTEAGKAVDVDDIAITVYKIDWRWWWDQSGESLAQFTANTHAHVVDEGKAKTSKGVGQWSFSVKYPQWGRYLIRACDTEGGHCTGRTFYVDWPYWAGRPQDQSGPGATTLSIVADKNDYQVGDVAHIDLPEGAVGRALLTLESGSRILDARWLDVRDGARRVDIPVAASMAPTVYASIELLQPHAGKNNDRPLRMLGIVPLKVNDPATRLHPELATDKEWQPEATVTVAVTEREKRAMTYTLAIVDEGLLGLTNFKTPSLHEHFFKREALGITTWDVFDEVVGGYGANLEKLLALGGSDAASNPVEHDKSRFPPVVRFLGPFSLKAGATAKHDVPLPHYVGAVRVMVVAGHEGAYGSAEKTVPVRQPLMLLPTLPRVLGPNEEIAVPISVFVNDPGINEVAVNIRVDEYFEVVGSKTAHLVFKQGVSRQMEEKLAVLRVKTRPRIGKAHITFEANSGLHKAYAEIYVDVRTPNPPTSEVTQQALQPGEAWKINVKPHGLFGTRSVNVEMSAVPPLNLGHRLEYLIHYPYGCVEQTTSSVFPQLFLPALAELDANRKREIEINVRAGIERLRDFQRLDGGFAYWPGGWSYGDGSVDPRYAWATTYVGHFLLEAEKQGFRVPSSMLTSWARYQRSVAQAWTPATGSTELDQAYRLYTLALSNNPEIGAMNRLREAPSLSTAARWMLAAAYKLTGLSEAAESLSKDGKIQIAEYLHPDNTFGSRLRDTAIVLNASVILGRKDTKSLVDAISGELASGSWHSTQSVAYALMAMSKFSGSAEPGPYTFEETVLGKTTQFSSVRPIHRNELKAFPEAGAEIVVKNTSSRTLFVSMIVRGVPPPGGDSAANSGLTLDVDYSDVDGKPIDVTRLSSGTDLIARVTVTNTRVFEIKNIALTQILPSGWEIHNDRMDGTVVSGERSGTYEAPWYARYLRDTRKAEYVDIRDDRIYSYFALNPGERIEFITHINAAYVGRYYLSSVSVEAMYDAAQYARTQGKWVEVGERKK